MRQTTPGYVYQKSRITDSRYRAINAVNKSTLWKMNQSPAHYKFALDHPSEDSTALRIGRAVHAAILQPKEFEKEWLVAPDVNRRTKEGQAAYAEFLEMAEGKEVLSSAEFSDVCRIAQSVRKDKAAAALLKDCTVEKPLFWKDEKTGLFCKCKVDALKPGIMIDVKTCSDASTKAFSRDCFRFGYDVQAAHYLDAIRTITGSSAQWYFIAIEKTEPYAINILKADTSFVDYGIIRRKELLQELKACKASNSWTGYGENDLILPGYMEG